MTTQKTLAIGTKVKFVNGSTHLIDGTIVGVRHLGTKYIQYQFLEVYGDRNQHECRLWLGESNVKQIIK